MYVMVKSKSCKQLPLHGKPSYKNGCIDNAKKKILLLPKALHISNYVGLLVNYVIFTTNFVVLNVVICFLQYIFFNLKHFNKTIFFRYKENYFRLGNSENSRFKLKISLDLGTKLYTSFIVNKYSIKEIE